MNITQQQFETFANEGYNRIPIIYEFLADLETPVSVYLKLANQPYTFLLESVSGGEKWARYSFIGLPCSNIIRVRQGGEITIHHNKKLIEKLTNDDPLSWIEQYQQQFRSPQIENFPRFSGGLVGYFGYDTVRYIEPRLKCCPNPDTLQLPEILLMESNDFVAFDNVSKKAYLVTYVDPEKENWKSGKQRLKNISQKLQTASAPLASKCSEQNSTLTFTPNFSKSEFESKVKKAVQYFIDGDAMQMTLSQRLSSPFTEAPINFYRALRSLNPSPYMYHFDFEDFHVIGSSPEILARLEKDTVTVRPLAGTRRRGTTSIEDEVLEKELLQDPKEIAEHLMLIDLARNDIGKISEYGSVKVTEKMTIERYSHVMHISSNVIGKIKKETTAIDVLRAAFPAGTLSGTPKIRAMEMIDELENEKRGVYAGAIGYLSWNKTMDAAIALRTAVIKNNIIYLQAGGGLVVDSQPSAEWEESMNKAKALIVAAEKARCYS